MVSKKTPASESPFKFPAREFALDFTATLRGRLRESPEELLQTPRDLERWLFAAGLVSNSVEVRSRDLQAARELREAIYRLARAAAKGEAWPSEDVRCLNRWAAIPPPAPRLESRGVRWVVSDAASALSAVARDAIELLGGPLSERIRECGGETCAVLFVDESRAGSRRWCSMTRCGNKAKVADFRKRQREASS